MNKCCNSSPCRENFAVALCYAATVLLGINALHTPHSMMVDMNVNQCFIFDAFGAAIFAFLGTLVLMRVLQKAVTRP